MNTQGILRRQHDNLIQAVRQYQELSVGLADGQHPTEVCYFFDQCVIGRIAEAVVSAVDTGYIAELEERIWELENNLNSSDTENK